MRRALHEVGTVSQKVARVVLALGVAVALPGCLTPSMGRQADVVMDCAEGRPAPAPRRHSPLDEEGLPHRLWYVDPSSRVYHERRTNTFVAWDEVKKGFVALPGRSAFGRFHPDRAKLLTSGAPPEVEKILDYLLEMEPEWRGSP